MKTAIWRTILLLMACGSVLSPSQLRAQCSPTSVYGVTLSGIIYPINLTATTATLGSALSVAPALVHNPNGMGYNASNGKFYLFNEDGSSTQNQFSTFTPGINPPTTGTWTTVSTSGPGSLQIPSGAVSSDGKGYYCMDVNGGLHYYDFTANTWTTITSTYKDQSGTDISSTVASESSGDMAFDGAGNLWILLSSSSKYGLYVWKAPLATGAVAQITLTQVIAPSTSTSNLGGGTVYGIAFNNIGQIVLSTSNDAIYLLKTATSAPLLLGSLPGGTHIKDLTSCNLPIGVLPVQFREFSCTAVKGEVELQWTALQSSNTNSYSVERSGDGHTWDLVATVSSNFIGGVERYTFTDHNPPDGTNFYRVVEIDKDGRSFFTDAKMVTIEPSADNAISLHLWPNPATTVLHLRWYDAHSGSVSIYNTLGHIMLQTTIIPGSNSIDLGNLSPGYYVCVAHVDGKSFTQKFVKD